MNARVVLRLALSLTLAALVLCAGALAGGAFRPAQAASAPAAKASEGVEGYAGASGEIAVGDALEVNGQPMQLSVFYTSDAPQQVALFYARAFQARGVLPIVSAEPQLAHVSGFDQRDGLQRFITAVPQPGGDTLVLVGVTNPRRPPRFTHGAGEAGFPVPPENRAFLGYRSTDAGAKAESGQFVSSLSPAGVLAFYRKELAGRGYSERKEDGSSSLAVFARGGSILSVALQALGGAGTGCDKGSAACADGRTGTAVFVNVTSGGPR